MAKLLFNPQEHPEVTFDDVFLLPNNDIEKKVYKVASDTVIKAEAAAFQGEKSQYRTHRNEILHIAEAHGIGGSFSRDDVDLTPAGGLGTNPIIGANMNNVTGLRMARALAMNGGIGAVPQDKSNEELLSIISTLRSSNTVYETPVSVREGTKIHEFSKLMAKRSHGTAVVTDENGIFLGVISMQDIPGGINADMSIGRFVRKDDLVTAPKDIEPFEALKTMNAHHVGYLPIVDEGNKVIGVLPKIDAAMRLRYAPNIDYRNGGLRAMYTIGALNKNPIDRVKFLLDQGVYDILLDTANFDQGIVPYRNIEKVLDVAAQRKVEINLMAGNVVTREAVRNIVAAGAKFVKVGVGPGAMCTTRMETGVGRPQVSAILECAEEAHKYGAHVVSDGGVRHPRDVAIAMAAGADYVMVGSLLTGTYESPSDLLKDGNGRQYKINYGMASTKASVLRTLGQDRNGKMSMFRDIIGHRSEGISESRVYLKEGKESVALLLHSLLDGLASSAAYANAKSVQEFASKAVMGIQTRSGFQEGAAKAEF